MKRFVNSAVLFGLTLALLSVVVQPVASAKMRDDKGSKPRLTWSTRKVQETVAAGTSKTVTVSFTSSADLSNVELRVSGGLARYVTVSVTPGALTSVKANTPVSVQIVMQIPADKAHDQGGVIQVRTGKRNLGKPLQVKIDVPGDDDEDEDD